MKGLLKWAKEPNGRGTIMWLSELISKYSESCQKSEIQLLNTDFNCLDMDKPVKLHKLS